MHYSFFASITGIVLTGMATLAVIPAVHASSQSTTNSPFLELGSQFPNFDQIPQLITQVTGKTGPAVTATSSPAAIELAKHLTKQKVVLYVAYWCPYCHRQKELFGREAVSFLTIVECASNGVNPQPQLCEEKRVEGYPSWEINGKMHTGIRSLRQLAKLSNYQGNRNF